jgi:Transposase IS4
MLHGTQVLRELVYPWRNTECVVCADSYFASVGAVKELRRLRLRFIGVVKTAIRTFPMAYLNTYKLHAGRGDRHGVCMKNANGSVEMLAFVWMDRERRYFVASAGSLNEGEPFVRQRWRQVDKTENASPEHVQLVVPQPKSVEIYYKVCAGKVDQHNRD